MQSTETSLNWTNREESLQTTNMEEVLRFAEKEIIQNVKECPTNDQMIKKIAEEIFSDKFNVTRIAFFMAFIAKWIEAHPETKHEIYEDFFKTMYFYLKL